MPQPAGATMMVAGLVSKGAKDRLRCSPATRNGSIGPFIRLELGFLWSGSRPARCWIDMQGSTCWTPMRGQHSVVQLIQVNRPPAPQVFDGDFHGHRQRANMHTLRSPVPGAAWPRTQGTAAAGLHRLHSSNAPVQMPPRFTRLCKSFSTAHQAGPSPPGLPETAFPPDAQPQRLRISQTRCCSVVAS